MKKAKYHHGNLKHAIIDAGIEIIQKQGMKMLSLRNVSGKIGVSHSALYRHYKNKEELIVSLSLNGFQKLTQILDKAIMKFTGDPKAQLKEMGRKYIQFAVNNPIYYRLMFGDYINNKTEYPDLFKAYDACFIKLIEVIMQYTNEKNDNKDNHMITAISIWSLLHGYASLILDNKKDKNVGSKIQIERILNKSLMLM
jgi:AcrR family transcriptional regulator